MKQTKTMMNAILEMMRRSVAIKNDKMVFANELPADAKHFLQENFPNQDVAYAEKKGTEYEINLNDGTEVTFSKEGFWDKVDCKLKSIPTTLLPENIIDNVKELFNDALVLCANKKGMAYSIMLSNGVSLKFDKEGRLA